LKAEAQVEEPEEQPEGITSEVVAREEEPEAVRQETAEKEETSKHEPQVAEHAHPQVEATKEEVKHVEHVEDDKEEEREEKVLAAEVNDAHKQKEEDEVEVANTRHQEVEKLIKLQATEAQPEPLTTAAPEPKKEQKVESEPPRNPESL
jgi:hypothetical protein